MALHGSRAILAPASNAHSFDGAWCVPGDGFCYAAHQEPLYAAAAAVRPPLQLAHAAIHIEFGARDKRRIRCREKQDGSRHFVRLTHAFHGHLRNQAAQNLLLRSFRQPHPLDDRSLNGTWADNIHADAAVNQLGCRRSARTNAAQPCSRNRRLHRACRWSRPPRRSG